MKNKLITSLLFSMFLSIVIPTYASALDGVTTPTEVQEDKAVYPNKGVVILDKCKGTVEICIYNKKQSCTLVIIKKDKDSKKPIPGVEFVIKDENDKEVYRGVTDSDGKITVELPCGKYYYEEVKPAEGYDLY